MSFDECRKLTKYDVHVTDLFCLSSICVSLDPRMCPLVVFTRLSLSVSEKYLTHLSESAAFVTINRVTKTFRITKPFLILLALSNLTEGKIYKSSNFISTYEIVLHIMLKHDGDKGTTEEFKTFYTFPEFWKEKYKLGVHNITYKSMNNMEPSKLGCNS